NRSGHNHEVALARAGAKHLRAEARDIEPRSRSGNHLDRAACQAERHGPNRRLARPVEDVIDRGDQKILLEPVVNPSHECLLSIPNSEPCKLSSRPGSPRRPSGGVCFFSTHHLRRLPHTQAVMSITVANRTSLGVSSRVFKRIADVQAHASGNEVIHAYGTI